MISIGTISYPQDEIEYSNKEMKMKINNSEYENGELIMTKRDIAWKRDNSDSQGFSIPWNKIVVQAVSSDDINRSIYFMVDCTWPNSSNSQNDQQIEQPASNGNGSSNNGSHEEIDEEIGEEEEEQFIDCDEEQEITEFWMIPNNSEEIDNIYYIMTRYPEPENMDENSDSDDNFLDGEDMGQMNINDDDRFAED